jgi:NADPH:quinone reductase-like Zn-dependent oxidoreductase
METLTARAVVYEEFGGTDQLRLARIPIESPGRGEIQVRPRAVSVNPIDGKIRRGELKLMSGRHFPKRTGQDFSGEVLAVGAGVADWKTGDEVYGCCRGMRAGALGDFVNVPADAVAARPAGLSHAEAASVPMVAQAALQALTHVAGAESGSRVLVNGCTGGFGLYALQIARHLGAHVTGVCDGASLDLAREYGAQEVVDYRTEKVTERADRFDVILELSGKLAFQEADPLLSERGIYVDVSPSPGSLITNTVTNPVRHHKHKFLLMSSHRADLERIAAWFADGTLRLPPVQVFPLDAFAEAYRTAESGSVNGKVVIRIDPAEDDAA